MGAWGLWQETQSCRVMLPSFRVASTTRIFNRGERMRIDKRRRVLVPTVAALLLLAGTAVVGARVGVTHRAAALPHAAKKARVDRVRVGRLRGKSDGGPRRRFAK